MSDELRAIRTLVRKADHDLINSRVALDHNVPTDTICFHIQQAAEKLLKALIASQGIDYPFTHDLDQLLTVAVQHFGQLAEFGDSLAAYTEYAVGVRYGDAPEPDVDEAKSALETVERLRHVIHGLLPPEALPDR
jgi:HEPN domain-containing protein